MRLGFTLSLCLFLLSSGPRAEPAQDANGRPVTDAQGLRLNHGPAGWDGHDSRPSWWRPQAALIPSAEAGAVEPPEWPGGPVWRPHDVDPALMRFDHVIGSANQQLGVTGIHSVDFDEDGLDEILVGHTSMWYVLDFDPDLGEYVQINFHQVGTGATFGGGGIVRVWPGDVDGDGDVEIVVLLTDDSLFIHDGRSGVFEQAFTAGLSGANDLLVGDVEPGLPEEIVVLDEAGLHVLLAGDALPLWSVPGVSGSDVTLGQLDADPALELAIAGADAVIDAGTQMVEWTFPLGFGALLWAGDIDGDGLDELACAEVWGDVFAVDGDTRSRKWTFDNFNTSAIRTGDVDGDGIHEVLVGDKQWGDVHARNGIDSSLVANIRNPEHSVAFIDLGDVDGDCDLEVLWGAGYSSTGRDALFVGDLLTSTQEWDSLEIDGPMYSSAVGDFDADGRQEVLWASANSRAGYDGALVFVTDLHQGRPDHVPAGPSNDGWMVTRDLVAANLDADPQLEYVMNASTTYTGRIGCWDGLTHEEEWRQGAFDGEYVSSLEGVDVDGDGVQDILVGTGREHTGADGTFLRHLNGVDGSVLWQSPNIPGGWGGVISVGGGNVDGDPAVELLAISTEGLFQYDAVTRMEELVHPMSDLRTMRVDDWDGDGDLEVLLGTANGELVVFDARTRTETLRQVIAPGAIYTLRLADIDGDDVRELVLTCDSPDGGIVRILAASTLTGLWDSPPLPGSPGLADSLHVADADDDGQNEIVVSLNGSIVVYEHSDGLVDATPPSYPGSVGLQSVANFVDPGCCPAIELTWAPAEDDKSPPIRYRMYRGDDPGFTPDASTYLGDSGQLAHRDATVAEDTEYTYLVRAADRFGNEETNDVRLTIRTNPATPPEAATLDSVVDVDPCQADGVDVFFTHPGAVAPLRHDVYMDGVLAASDVSSPARVAAVPPGSHDFEVRTAWTTCPLESVSNSLPGEDVRPSLPAPTIVSIIDDDSCALGGSTLTFEHDGFPAGGHYELWVDDVLVDADISSPWSISPPDDAQHRYVVRAVEDACDFGVDSAGSLHVDGRIQTPTPVIVGVVTVEPCSPGTARVDFTHPGFPISGRYELWRDGSLFLGPIVSGTVFPVLDNDSHSYTVRAIEDVCDSQADSDPVEHLVGEPEIEPPTNLVLVDLDPCAASSAQVFFDHPGFTGDGHYELWRDGALFLSFIVDGSVVPMGDTDEHSYVIRAVEDTCGGFAESAPTLHAEAESCGEVRLRVATLAGGDSELSWGPVDGAQSYNAYVGTLESLRSDTYDHAKTRTGVGFPDSPSPGDGCDVSAGPNLTARVQGLLTGEAFYFLVSAVDASGEEGGYGRNSSEAERKDPALDPRGDEFFCR